MVNLTLNVILADTGAALEIHLSLLHEMRYLQTTGSTPTNLASKTTGR